VCDTEVQAGERLEASRDRKGAVRWFRDFGDEQCHGLALLVDHVLKSTPDILPSTN
jgi:hypothetical protein